MTLPAIVPPRVSMRMISSPSWGVSALMPVTRTRERSVTVKRSLPFGTAAIAKRPSGPVLRGSLSQLRNWFVLPSIFSVQRAQRVTASG